MRSPAEKDYRLVVAAESGRIDAGVVRNGHWLGRAEEQGNPVETLASVLRRALQDSGVSPQQLSAWIYSGGPGSLLGLRSLAIIFETWAAIDNSMEPIPRLRFSGMVWTARHLLAKRDLSTFVLASPWRKGAWNFLRVEDQPPSEKDLTVVEGEPDPHGLPVFRLGDRPGTIPLARSIPVELPPFEEIIEFIDSPGFLRPTQRVEPIQSGTTRYRKWTPTYSIPSTSE